MTAMQITPGAQIESFSHAAAIRDQIVWNRLEAVTVEHALKEWLATLSDRTERNYRSGLNMLAGIGLIDPLITLQGFSLVNHDAIVDIIVS